MSYGNYEVILGAWNASYHPGSEIQGKSDIVFIQAAELSLVSVDVRGGPKQAYKPPHSSRRLGTDVFPPLRLLVMVVVRLRALVVTPQTVSYDSGVDAQEDNVIRLVPS